jgi:hypothetical protein
MKTMGLMSDHVSSKALWGLAVIFFAVSTVLVFISPSAFLYDESYYFQYAVQLADKGFGTAYLRELNSPTGPLYAFVHQMLSLITDLRIVPMRLMTNLMFAASAMMVAIMLSMVRVQNPTSVPALAYGIPFAGVTFGLALTEVPAMLAASVGTLALIKGLLMVDVWCKGVKTAGQPPKIAAYAFFVLAGLLYASAVWGRQNYLAAVLALPVLFVSNRGFALLPWLLVTAITCGLSAMLFVTWGGLVPEAVRYVSNDARSGFDNGIVAGLNIVYGIYALGYTAFLFCVLSPRVFVARVGVIALSAALAVVAVVSLKTLRLLPSKFLLERLLGSSAMDLVGIAAGTLFSFLGFWLLLSVLLRCYAVAGGRETRSEVSAPHGAKLITSLLTGLRGLEMKDKLYLFASLAWLLILASNMKILHQFNSRYVVVAAPFLLITAARHFEATRSSVIRLVCGFTVSMIFLANYYRWL